MAGHTEAPGMGASMPVQEQEVRQTTEFLAGGQVERNLPEAKETGHVGEKTLPDSAGVPDRFKVREREKGDNSYPGVS